MASGDIYLCRLEFTTWDVNHSISFHVQEDSDTSEGEGAIECAKAADAALTAEFAACLSIDTVIEAWYCLRVNTPENPGLKQLNNQKGDDAAASYPPNTAAVFSFRGEHPDLKRAGRFYLGGLPKDKVEGGVLDPAYLAGPVAALRAKILGGFFAGPFTAGPGVYRTVDNSLPPVVVPVFIAIDEVVVDQVLFSQRRRTSDSRGTSA